MAEGRSAEQLIGMQPGDLQQVGPLIKLEEGPGHRGVMQQSPLRAQLQQGVTMPMSHQSPMQTLSRPGQQQTPSPAQPQPSPGRPVSTPQPSPIQAQLQPSPHSQHPPNRGPTPLVQKPVIPQQTFQQILMMLRQHGYQETEEALVRESRYRQKPQTDGSTQQRPQGQDANALADYQGPTRKPNDYFSDYQSLVSFIDARALDSHRAELSSLIYPTFVHMYLEMVANRQRSEAQQFFSEFVKYQEPYWEQDLKILSTILEPHQLTSSDWFQHLKDNTFVIRLAREPFDSFMPFLQTKSLLGDLLKRHVHIEIFDGVPREKDVCDSTRGSFSGDSLVKLNMYKIYHGLLRDPTVPGLGYELDEDTSGKNKKKSKIKDLGPQSKRLRADPNAPPPNKRIPLPDMTDEMKLERHIAAKEISKRLKISADKLPSVCMYTVTNAGPGGVCSAEVTEDSTLLAMGLDDSIVKVYSLDHDELKPLKSIDELESIDRDSDDLRIEMIDDSVASKSVSFSGHSGPVFGVSFAPDKSTLLSCSEDGTIRLWSMQLWSNLVAFKAGTLPIWDVKFGPYGHYFASGSADKSAALWSVDRHVPVRLFVGHFSDINTVSFHPNSHYIATGSADRSVRVWDLLTGQNVRVFSGSKGGIQSLTFSPCGQMLIAGDEAGHLLIWDLANGRLMANISAHTDTIGTLAFSREGSVLATGSTDCSMGLYSLNNFMLELDAISESNKPPSVVRTSAAGMSLTNFRTKSTPVVNLSFSRRNLLLGIGCFEG